MSVVFKEIVAHTRTQLRLLWLQLRRRQLVSTLVILLLVPALVPAVLKILDEEGVLGTENFVVEEREYPAISALSAADAALQGWRAHPEQLAFAPSDNAAAMDVAARVCGMLDVDFADARKLSTSDDPARQLFDLEGEAQPVRVAVLFGEAQPNVDKAGDSLNFTIFQRADRGDARVLEGSVLSDFLGDNSASQEEPLLVSGATLVQAAVNRAVLDRLAGAPSPVGSFPDAWALQRLPDAASETQNPTRRIIYALFFATAMGQTAVLVLAGRQEARGERRALMLHGMRPQAFVLAHFLLGAARGLVAAGIALAVGFGTRIFVSDGAGYVVAGFLLFAVAQSAWITTLAAAGGRLLGPTSAMAIGLLSSLVLSVGALAVQTILFDPEAFGVDVEPASAGQLAPTFLLPQVAFANILWSAGAAAAPATSNAFAAPSSSSAFPEDISSLALGMLVLDAVLWLLVALALDTARFSKVCGAGRAAPLSDADRARNAVAVRNVSRHFFVTAPDLHKSLLAAADEDAAALGEEDLSVRADTELVARRLTGGERFALYIGFPPQQPYVPRAMLDDKGHLLSSKKQRALLEAREGKQKRYGLFGGKVRLRAVDGLDLEVRRGELLCLLGQNGAGKSTAMEMLVGGLKPTSGDIWVDGLPISEDPGLMRGRLGLCKQHDVVFHQLSCLELLEVCGTFHGMAPEAARAEGAALLDRLGIGFKAQSRPQTLSGGQLRRLSVATAVIGSPPVIFLDECTTGLDVKNRKAVWELLESLKGDHTIVLTTHSMEEAEALGDRIVIMADGKVQAQGSLRELRQHFGAWMHLACVRTRDVGAEGGGSGDAVEDTETLRARREAQADAILAAVRDVVPEAEVLRSAGPKLSFNLPLASKRRFPALFEALEARKSELGLRSFAVSPSTLDDVFLRLAGDLAAEKRAKRTERMRAAGLVKAASSGNGQLAREDSAALGDVSMLRKQASQRSNGNGNNDDDDMGLRPTWKRQARALAGQVTRMTLRRPASMIQVFVIPIFYGVIGGLLLLVIRLTQFDETTGPLSLGDAGPVPFATVDNATEVQQTLGADLLSFQVPPAILLNITATVFAVGGLDFRSALPVTGAPPAPVPGLDVGVVYNQAFFSPGNTLLQLVYERVGAAAGALAGAGDLRCTYLTWPAPFNSGSPQATIGMHMPAIGLCIIAGTAATEMARHRQEHVKAMVLHTGVSQALYWATFGVMHTLLAFISSLVVLFVLLAFQMEALLDGAGFGLLVLALLIITPANTATAYVFSLPFKTADGAEQLLIWVLLMPFFLAWAVSAYAFGSDPEPAFDNAMTVLSPSFGLYRGLVTAQAAALNGTPLSFADGFDWALGFAPVLAFSAVSLIFWLAIMYAVGFEHSHGTLLSRPGRWLKRLTSRGRRVRSASEDERVRERRSKQAGGDDGDLEAGDEAEMDVAESALDPEYEEESAELRLQREEENVRCVMAGTLPPPLPAFPPRDSYGAASELPLRTYHLSKRFGELQALRDVTLGASRGSILGLLGPNGSGKSTLCASVTRFEGYGPDSGDAFVDGHSVRTDMPSVRRKIGLCPQFDALVQVLTPREMLRDTCNIRGVPVDKVEAVVDSVLKGLGLNPKADVPCGTLSGGNKRRLSIAQAVVASPAVVILDEPTTGLDSATRRECWQELLRSSYGSKHAYVLTTHSLEEADALCERLVIMVAGSVRAAGTSEDLKTRYGAGVTVRLEMREGLQGEEARAAADAAVGALRPDGVAELVKQQRGVDFQYLVPAEGLSWSRVFEVLLENGDVDEFSVAQRSLDDVFVQLASLQ